MSKKNQKKLMVLEMGRINVDLSDELDKKLRFKTAKVYGGRKGDLSRAVEDAVTLWVANEHPDAPTRSGI